MPDTGKKLSSLTTNQNNLWPQGADAPYTLLQAFEAQAAQAPQAIALIDGERQLTYGALNSEANQLARYLREHGVGPDILVGICLERSLEMVTGLLGILKAGGAYVPLDPAYPAQRIAYMLDDARPAVLLTGSRLLAEMPALGGSDASAQPAMHVCCMDARREAIAACPAHDLPHSASPSDLAYVIYTSGSTGHPKGVAIEHASLANFLCSMAQAPGVDSADVVLGLTSLSFDIAALELFLPLGVGATVVLASREAATDPGQLWHLIRQFRITMVQATPSTWRMLLDHGWPELPWPVRVLSGGEALPPDLLKRMLAHVPAVWNMYGPTETTVWSTLRQITAADPRCAIGRPIANTSVYILGAGLQPVAQGMPGELHIGGAGLARGYLRRPELTAGKFIADPFSQTAGARLYKTGDLARYLPDGDLDCLGRIDEQVKIRGFRIELGEIEAALAALPAVRNVVVVAREDTPGEPALAAYLVAQEGATLPAAHELRQHLLQSLPDYMVPASFTLLAQLPLTPNGKIDRKALPAPDTRAGESAYAAPTTAMQQQLAGVWADMLKRERVGIHDNFFALGGHSLLVVRMTLRLKSQLNLEVQLQDVFKAPTVAALAALLSARTQAGVAGQAPIQAPGAPTGRPSFSQEDLLPYLQKGNIAGDEMFTIRSAWRLDGSLDIARLQAAFNHVLTRHEALRSRFVSAADGVVVEVAQNVRTPFHIENLEAFAHDDAAVRRHVMAALYVPLDIACAPLLRCTVHRLGEQHYIIGLAVSHLVFDGESAPIFWSEVVRAYEALVAGQVPALGELPLPYSAFADWQRHFMANDPLAMAQTAYWRERLAGMSGMLQLPYDFARPPVFSHQGAVIAGALEPELVAIVREQGKRQGWTVYAQCIAALFAMLGSETGERDFFLYASSDGRTTSELVGSIGFYSRAAIIRGEVEPFDSCAELVSQIQERVFEALSNQYVPRSDIGAMLPKPDASYGASLQIGFSYVRVGDTGVTLDGVSMQRYPCGLDTTHNDLRVTLVESAAGIDLEFKYYREVFAPATMQRMLTRMIAALAFCCEAAEDREVDELFAHVRQISPAAANALDQA